MLARRSLLLGASAAVPLALLAGCATQGGGTVPPTTMTPASVVHDIGLIATAFAGAIVRVNLAPDRMAMMTQAANDLTEVAKAFTTADTTAQAQPLVTRVSADINAVVAATAGAQLPEAVASKIQAAQALLPLIEMAVGMVVALASPSSNLMPAAKARQELAAPY